MFDTVRNFIRPGDAGPNTYRCDACDRTFEVDAPPSRVICSDCGNRDVRQVEA